MPVRVQRAIVRLTLLGLALMAIAAGCHSTISNGDAGAGTDARIDRAARADAVVDRPKGPADGPAPVDAGSDGPVQCCLPIDGSDPGCPCAGADLNCAAGGPKHCGYACPSNPSLVGCDCRSVDGGTPTMTCQILI